MNRRTPRIIRRTPRTIRGIPRNFRGPAESGAAIRPMGVGGPHERFAAPARSSAPPASLTMPNDYIPRPDAMLDAWGENLVNWLGGHYAEVGLAEADYLAIKGAFYAYRDAYTANTAARAAAAAARSEKDALRRGLTDTLRPLIRIAQAFPGTTDAARASMGITTPGAMAEPATFARSHPTARIDSGLRLRHTLRVRDAAAPERTARAAGALGAEVRLALVEAGDPAPPDPAVYRFLALATDGRASADFTLADGGRTACYILRWTGPRGRVGPWSAAHTATIAA